MYGDWMRHYYHCWYNCWALQWLLQSAIRIAIGVVSQGPMPQHIAVIMDGNRRFAHTRQLEDKRLGHYHGYRTLESVLNWCFQLGIKCVTIYAFSVENFKRSEEEVATLMELAVEKLSLMSAHSELISKNRVSVRVIGELDMLPEPVRRAAEKVMDATAHYHNFTLNICFPYTSKLEMGRAMKRYRELRSDERLAEFDDSELYRSCLDTFDLPDIDILIRTSGEKRLSEFLLHQLSASPHCQYEFVDCMWPDFSLTRLIVILLRFQNNSRKNRTREGHATVQERVGLIQQKLDACRRAVTENIGR